MANKHPLEKIMDLIYSYPSTDLEIKIEGETKRVHRYILALKSGTFRRLITDQRVPMYTLYIDGLKTAVFNLMIFFSYTAELPQDLKGFDLVLNLYEAAINYEMPELRVKCLLIIKKLMNSTNVEQVFEIAQLYNDFSLKEIILEFYDIGQKSLEPGAIKMKEFKNKS